MVKNTHGGSGHKKFGRKFANTSGTSKLRVSECDDEMYAIVKKMCGNGMVHVHCIDGGSRLCRIRGKFTGRRKKDNFITIGSWVMVGLHDYDDVRSAIVATTFMASASNTKVKLNDCDLLEVYNSSEKEQLKSNVDADWSVLISNDTSTLSGDNDKVSEHSNGTSNGSNIKFTTEYDDDLETLLQTSSDAKIIGSTTETGKVVDIDGI